MLSTYLVCSFFRLAYTTNHCDIVVLKALKADQRWLRHWVGVHGCQRHLCFSCFKSSLNSCLQTKLTADALAKLEDHRCAESSCGKCTRPTQSLVRFAFMQEQGPEEAGEGSKKAATTPLFTFKNVARCHMLLSLVWLATCVEEPVLQHCIASCGGFPRQIPFLVHVFYSWAGIQKTWQGQGCYGWHTGQGAILVALMAMGPHATTDRYTMVYISKHIPKYSQHNRNFDISNVRLEDWLVVSR